MDLVVGRAYYLQGMEAEMWDSPHPRFGAPWALATRYLGSVQGARRWHAFEVWVENKEEGVLFMNDADLKRIRVEAI